MYKWQWLYGASRMNEHDDGTPPDANLEDEFHSAVCSPVEEDTKLDKDWGGVKQ